jgi:polar amino acid transport system substrate-binding protein
MKRKVLYALILSIILTIVFANRYIEIEYDISMIEYFSKFRGLTREEEEWLDNHGNIIYGSDYSSPPLRYKDEKNGQYRGLIVDYIMALSVELGTEIQFKPDATWAQSLDALYRRETDFMDIIISKERDKTYDFSDPIYNLRETLVFSKDEQGIRGYKELEGKKIAVPKKDHALEYLKEKKINTDYTYTEDMEEAMEKLRDGEVDVVAGDEPVIIHFLEKMNVKDKFQTLDKPMFEKPVGLAVSESEDILISILNKAIFNLKRKNTMIKIQQKWLGMSVTFDNNSSEKFSLMILIFLTIILMIVYIFSSWNTILKGEVEKRTRQLYVSRNNLQTTFDGLTHFMIVIDRNHKVVNINKAFCKIIKKRRRKIIGNVYTGFTDILTVDGNEYVIEDTFNQARHYEKEFKYKEKIFKLSTYPLKDYRSKFMNVLIMIEDITNMKIIEKQILHEDKMAAVGQLAAGVAHEIRNPLGLIRNYCYVLKRNINKDSVKKEKSISIIENSVQRASEIIDNLLNFSRVSNYKRENTNVKKSIINIINLHHKTFERNNISYKIMCDDSLVCCVNTEALKHVFINLILNSIDAMSDGGIIRIQCARNENSLLITFSDNGCGISKENLKNIFNPFFTTKPIGKGTGLGMYIVYNEIEKCGGEIRVESEVGKGTYFYITLPLNEVKTDEVNE